MIIISSYNDYYINLHSWTNCESLTFPSTLFALFVVNTNLYDALYSVIFGMLDVVMCYIEINK